MKTKTKAKKVWRIFHFKERFELPDDIRWRRKQPLAYIRDYVGSGETDESINYKRQIMDCKSKPDRHKLLAAFSDLREIAANHTRAYRGYLLDERFEPADVDKIAIWIGLTANETGKILKELTQIGLIEMVTLPKFDLSINEDPQKNRRYKKGKTRRISKTHGKARIISNAHEKSRATSSAHEKALKKDKYKSESGNRRLKRSKKSGKPDSKAQPTGATAEKRQGQTNSNPTNNPKGSDGGVGNHKLRICTDPPRQSITHQYKDPQQLGAILQKLYNPEAEEFAQAVYKAIGTPYSLDSQEGRSELACFKMAWAKAQIAGIAPRFLTELWDRIIQEAEKLKCKRRRKSIRWKKSPEAVLRWMFDRFLKKAKQQAEQAESKRAKGIG